jgi:hypothetical protein
VRARGEKGELLSQINIQYIRTSQNGRIERGGKREDGRGEGRERDREIEGERAGREGGRERHTVSF